MRDSVMTCQRAPSDTENLWIDTALTFKADTGNPLHFNSDSAKKQCARLYEQFEIMRGSQYFGIGRNIWAGAPNQIISMHWGMAARGNNYFHLDPSVFWGLFAALISPSHPYAAASRTTEFRRILQSALHETAHAVYNREHPEATAAPNFQSEYFKWLNTPGQMNSCVR